MSNTHLEVCVFQPQNITMSWLSVDANLFICVFFMFRRPGRGQMKHMFPFSLLWQKHIHMHRQTHTMAICSHSEMVPHPVSNTLGNWAQALLVACFTTLWYAPVIKNRWQAIITGIGINLISPAHGASLVLEGWGAFCKQSHPAANTV